MKKNAILIGVICLCCTLVCSSCNKMPALCKKVTVSYSIAQVDKYENALKEIAETYSYTFVPDKLTIDKQNSGAIGRYSIQIDDLSDVYIYINNKNEIERFLLIYSDQLSSQDTKLRGYNETLIHSLVDLANCMSGKKFSYDECYEFFQRDHSLTQPERGVIEDDHLGLDFWETWTVSYGLAKDPQTKGFKETVSFDGNTLLSTW